MAAVDADLTHLDAAMAARIMARRQTELARRQRLLDPRRRTIGQDMEALKAQVGEMATNRQNSVSDDKDAQAEAMYLDSMAIEQERERAAEVKADEKDLVAFNRKHTRKETRKEYWMSDPDGLKREKPLSAEEIDSLGQSAVLAYGGYSEPPNHLQEKQAYLRACLSEQIEEKKHERALEAEMDVAHADAAERANTLRLFIEQEKQRESQEEAANIQQFNTSLARTVQQQRKAFREKEDNAKFAELEFNKTSQLLNEAEFVLGPDGRILPDSFKRMTVEQTQAILDEQAYQMIEKRQALEAEREEDRQYAQELELQRQCVDAIEQEKQRRAAVKRMAYSKQYQEDARTHAKAQQEIGKVYTNSIAPSFFDQFGRSAR
jgi:hypothetical protein